jgi:hypothetical protein
LASPCMFSCRAFAPATVAAVKVIDPANSDLEKLAGTGPPPVG